MSKKGDIYNLFFNLGKSTIEVAEELKVSKQYVSKILKAEYSEEYIIEKGNRKLKNMEKRAPRKYEDEGHYIYRDRPLMPDETMSTLAFIKANRQSYITNKETGELMFDKTRGGISKDLPLKYTPIPY